MILEGRINGQAPLGTGAVVRALEELVLPVIHNHSQEIHDARDGQVHIVVLPALVDVFAIDSVAVLSELEIKADIEVEGVGEADWVRPEVVLLEVKPLDDAINGCTNLVFREI